MKTTILPIDYDYFDFQGRNYIKIIGRNDKAKRICLVDTCEVYFWAILKEDLSKEKIDKLIEKINKIKLNVKGRNTKVEKTEIHNKKFLGKDVKAVKIFATNYKDLHEIADNLGLPEIEKRRGYDLGFITHYVIEKKIFPLNWYEIEAEEINDSRDFGGISNIDVDICLKLKKAVKISDDNLINNNLIKTAVKVKDINNKKIITNESEPNLRGGRAISREKTGNPVTSEVVSEENIFGGFKALAYDLEVDELKIGQGEILMISLVSDNFKKVITWKQVHKKLDYIEQVKDESELIEKFIEYVKKISPDFLIGYFSDGFDLPYLKARAEKYKIKLNLGLDDSQPKFHKGIITTGKISGIVHIDLLRFIQSVYSQYMQSETLSLNEVANEFLGDTKKDFKFKHSSKIEKDEWEKYFEYNLHDSVLTYNLFQKFWPDMIEFTRVVQEPIFDVSRNGMSSNVEDYIIHNLEKFNEIPEKRPTHDEIGSRRQREKYEGAFVFEPVPGMYENLAIFDFTSMHASIIASYNLSKSTILEKKEKDCVESPEFELNGQKRKFYFSKEKGFFPALLEEIVKLRKKYKRELKEKPDAIKKARSNAYKLLANAYYGYMGFFGARYYSVESAATTLAFVRKFNKWTIERVNKEGYKVIFGDTDSVGFILNNKPKKDVLDFLKKLNSELPGIMELELEGFFKRGIWVTKRTGTTGAKKKYALIDESGKTKIRGFETVRRDWCFLPNTDILSEEGVKSIKDIRKGERVLTHRGKFKQVNKILKRKYSGNLFEIYPYYLQKIEVTPEHPILAIKTKRCCYMSNTICKINCKRKKDWCKHYYTKYKKDWLKASELSVGDILLSPIIKENVNKTITIKDLLNPLEFITERKIIRNVKESYSSVKISNQRISKELCYLFGLYLSEGYATNTYHNYIRFSFNRKEQKLIEKTRFLMKKLFLVNASIVERNSPGRENVTEIIFYSRILSSLFKKLFGSGASKKKLPLWVLKLPDKYQIALVRGMFDGDGSYKNIRFRGITYSTISKSLAVQFQEILLRLGLISSLKVSKLNPSIINKRKIISKNNLYSVTISGEQLKKAEKIFDIKYPWVKKRIKTGQHGYIDKNYAYIPIRKISNRDYNGLVYNLEVKEQNSYTANGVAVHNCNLAREVQNRIIQMILQDGNEKKALEYVKTIVKKIKNREISKEQIMIRTQLKKSISEYKAISPHVIAAKKMHEREMPVDAGNLIYFFIAETRDKKKLIREMVKLPDEKGEYNIKYYLNNQILPAVENIFQVFNINIKEIIEGKKQMTLF